MCSCRPVLGLAFSHAPEMGKASVRPLVRKGVLQHRARRFMEALWWQVWEPTKVSHHFSVFRGGTPSRGPWRLDGAGLGQAPLL